MIELLGSLTFIAIFSIASIIGMIIALENEKEGTASFMVSLVLGLLAWNYGRDVMCFIQDNYIQSILFSVGYIVVGVIWSFIRWNEKVKTVFRKFGEFKRNFIKTEGPITEERVKLFNSELSGKFRDSNGHTISISVNDSMEQIANRITPEGLKNKSLIISWIGYWPLSVIGTLLNNPFRRLFEWIYDSLSGFYDKIANKHKNEAFKDLK